MPSVTTILDYHMEPELVAWYLKKGKVAATRLSDEAKQIGTWMDIVVKADCLDRLPVHQNLLPGLEERVASCKAAWQRFKQENPDAVGAMQVFEGELTEGDLIGYPDFLLMAGEGVLDLKTSRFLQPKHWTQVCQYRRMLKTPTFVALLRLDKETGEYEYKTIEDIDVLRYEEKVFDAYRVAYDHAQVVRERTRQILEEEVLAL